MHISVSDRVAKLLCFCYHKYRVTPKTKSSYHSKLNLLSHLLGPLFLFQTIRSYMHKEYFIISLRNPDLVIAISATYIVKVYVLKKGRQLLKILKILVCIMDEISYSSSSLNLLPSSTGYPKPPPMMAASSIVTS